MYTPRPRIIKAPSFLEICAAVNSGIFAAYEPSKRTKRLITDWGASSGLGDRLISEDDLHLTTVYSPDPFPFEPLGTAPLDCKFKEFKLFGDDKDEEKTLVAVLENAFLHKLFARRKAAGAQWSFPSYIPHITLAKRVTEEEMDDLPPMSFSFTLAREYTTPLDTEFSYDKEDTKVDVAAALRRIGIWASRRLRGNLYDHKNLP